MTSPSPQNNQPSPLPPEDARPSETGKGVFWSSWGGSVLIHLVFFALVFLVIQSERSERGIQGNRETGPVGIVISQDPSGGSDGSVNNDSLSDTASKKSEIDRASLNEILHPQDRLGVAPLSETAANRSEREESMSGQNGTSGNREGEEGESTGTGKGNGSGEGQTVAFGGLKGKGRRFVYVLDRSESMRWPGDLPIRYAIREAQASIASLDPQEGARKFQIVYYHHDAQVFGDGRLLDVTAANKQKAANFLNTLSASGGTDPLSAIEKAIHLSPDVIFFLTDADEEISPMILARIREMRMRARVGQIHVIEFGKPNTKKIYSFKKLAEQNNGVYIFKDVTAL